MATQGPGRFGRRWMLPTLAAVAVAGLAIGMVLLVSDEQPRSQPTPAVSATTTSAHSSASASTSAATSTSSSVTSHPTSTSPAASPSGFDLGYVPLWPFATYSQAEQWRTSGGGSQPWHADAGETALNFTRGYLRFDEIDRVTSTKTDADGAHIGVGFRNPTGTLATAAVLHLVRFGSASDAPWEVVGSDDTTFTFENPRYGSSVSSPVTVGGHITGVDENIHVWVRQIGKEQPVGEKCCLPAGGQNSQWSMTVSFAARGDLTLVASTGGHLQRVERFAIQGVRAS